MENIESLIVNLPEDVEKYVYYGDFQKAEKFIDVYLERNVGQILKDRLLYEKEIIKRLKKDYIYSYDEALEMAKKAIKDFDEKELEWMKDKGYADWIYIDGKIKFHKNFLETILKTCLEIESRLYEKDEKNEKANLLQNTVEDIIEKGEKSYFIHIKTGIKLKKYSSEIGETIKVYLPIPKEAQQIKSIKILSTSPNIKLISPEDYPQRTVYFEEKVKGEDAFTVEYSYENHIKYNKLNYNNVSSIQPDFCTEEKLPHIAFTPYLIKLTQEVTGNETNPLKKARKIYDYITQNVRYSFMREYAAFTNIPEYAALNLKGDCGVQALLFITMCRIAKIPARWQSGLYVTPFSIGCHDWAEFYIAPYGWLFADLSFGGSAYREGNIKRWNYYFGNLDPFRMVANSDFQYELLPEKKFLRNDPYDNQVGEAEYLHKGLYNDDFELIKEIIDVHEI
ncbi:MAG TPA: transglutaminase [Clostridiaceae bacterium]|jgi:transglutaminase-like putative cysteine protease|nr:transglutaminase [Clostridiaceae bacterium]HBF76426.1 transglutaminase [Clostridiaceae bacterium]HBG39478.1 transglutaminase [Clostridiaceae bacterium]HBN28181.1 transglutaminase [Clostridiaceae bacterium]HBX47897.1 transglutaminase [Clostridiaceae bacterium]